MFKNRLHLLVILALGASSAGFAAEFHVALDDNDANPGTAGKPFATIGKARDAARAKAGPHTILLAPGRYFHTEPIMLDDRDSGLTIKGSKPGAAAEVYGGVPITGWEKWKDGIWRAAVPKDQRFYNLIVDGKPAIMAQTPNLGSGFGGGASIGATRRWESRRNGELIGKLSPGQSECAVKNAAGIHDLYLVFPASDVSSLDGFRFEP